MPRIVLNQVLKGRQCMYRVIKPLAQNVFQAIIEGTRVPVLVKMASDSPKLFLNEAHTYRYDCITKSPYARSLREHIDNGNSYCLVLEWLDSTLRETKDESTKAKSKVFKTVAKSCLEALAMFEDMDNADLNLNNILISGFSNPTPVVKVADLGWTTRAGFKVDGVAGIQGDAIRAPEIWKDENHSPTCDVLSLGVSMSSRIIFGIGGCSIQTNQPQEVTEAAWSIAELHKLRGAGLESPIDDRYVMEWAITEKILSQDLLQTPSLKDELEQKQVPPELISFIEPPLVVDSKTRPCVAKALTHPLLSE